MDKKKENVTTSQTDMVSKAYERTKKIKNKKKEENIPDMQTARRKIGQPCIK